MASKRTEIEELNRILSDYLERLGMGDEAKLEFISKANSMTALDSYRSNWFHRFTSQLSGILQQIQLQRPEIDLNEPDPPPQHHNKAEDEGRSHGQGKREREGSQRVTTSAAPPLRIIDLSDHSD